MRALFASIWSYRAFVLASILNNFRARFVRSRFGALWGIFHPLAQVAVFFLILSHVLGARLQGMTSGYGYAIYLCSGILAWQLFADVVSRCTTIFIDNASLIKKVSFPKICLLLIVAGETLLNNLLLLAAVLLMCLLAGFWPGWMILWIVPLMLVNLAFAMGLGMTLGVLNVFVRDVGQIVQVVLQFLFWLTPVVYLPSTLPGHLQQLLAINPLFTLVSSYQQAFVYQRAPDLVFVGVAAAVALVLIAAFIKLYWRAQGEMADQL